MSLRPLASLTVKMVGLYACINALPTISVALAPLVISDSVSATFFSPWKLALVNISGGVLQILVGIGLWAFSDGIAQSAVPQDGDVPLRRDEGLMAIGFSVVGVYLLADFATRLTTYGANVYVVSRPNSPFRPETMHIGGADLFPILVRGAIALYLLFGAKGLVRGLASFKNVGRDAVPPTDEF